MILRVFSNPNDSISFSREKKKIKKLEEIPPKNRAVQKQQRCPSTTLQKANNLQKQWHPPKQKLVYEAKQRVYYKRALSSDLASSSICKTFFPIKLYDIKSRKKIKEGFVRSTQQGNFRGFCFYTKNIGSAGRFLSFYLFLPSTASLLAVATSYYGYVLFNFQYND